MISWHFFLLRVPRTRIEGMVHVPCSLSRKRRSKRLRLPPRRVRLPEPVAQIRVFHVLDDGSILEDKRDLSKAARVERPEYHFFAAERGLEVINAVGNVRPVPEFP